MNNTGAACAKCTERCVLFHGSGKDSTTSYSFFKIMFGDRFSNALFFPPTVAPLLSALVNKEVKLEDTNGKQWKARVCYTQGSYSLQEGWSLFLSEHGVELGDFLVFHYVGEAHFLVDFYGWRTACQKVDFSEYSNESRSQNGIPSVAGKAEPSTKKAKASAGKVGSNTSAGAGRGNVNRDGRSRGAEGIRLESATTTVKIGTKESLVAAKMKSSIDVPVDQQCKGNSGPGLGVHSEAGSDGKVLIQKKPACAISLEAPKLKTIEENLKYGVRCKHSDVSKSNALAHPVTSSKPKTSTDPKNSARMRNVVLQGCSLSNALSTKQSGKEPVVIDLEQMEVSNLPIGDRSKAPGAKKLEATKMVIDLEQLQESNLPIGDRSNAPRAKKLEATKMVIDPEQLQVSNLPVGDGSNAPRAQKLEAAKMVIDPEQLQESKLPVGNRRNGPGAKKLEATKMVIDPELLQVSNLPIGDGSNAPGAKKLEGTKMVIDLEQLGDGSSAPRVKKLEAAKMGTREELPIVPSKIEKDSAWMKHELVMVEDSPSPAESKFTCPITDQQPFLELPELLSGMFKKRRGRPLIHNNMFVLLRDPEMRLWPVFYHEEKKYNAKVFACGWKAFSEANSIQTGDECVFGVECEVEANPTLQVSIVRKLQLGC